MAIERARDHRIPVASIDSAIRHKTPTGIGTFGLSKGKAASGRKAVGAYAFGYRGRGTGRDRDAAPDPTVQAAVRRIVELRKGGASYRAIAKMLDTDGYKAHRASAWSAMAVRNIAVREQVA